MISRTELVQIISGFLVGYLILAFFQGWIKLQFIHFIIFFGMVAGFLYFFNRKVSKSISYKEAWEISLPVFKRYGINIGREPKMDWISRHSDNRRFSSSGKIWDIRTRNLPKNGVVQLDAKTGEIVNIATNIKREDSPVGLGWSTPTIDPERFVYWPKRDKEKE